MAALGYGCQAGVHGPREKMAERKISAAVGSNLLAESRRSKR
jgi:hypothetical protein